MTKTLDHNTLSAYADGALDTEAAAEVEAALADMPAAREELRWIEDSRRLLREAYGDIVAEPLPARVWASLAASGAGGSADRPAAARTQGGIRAWGLPAMAASLIAFFIGLPSGYLLSDMRHSETLARMEALHAADQRAMAAAVTDALEKHLSGNTVDWQVPASGSRGAVTPIRSFRNSDGQWCREYRQVTTTVGGETLRHGIACRSQDGDWQTRVIALDETS